VTEQRSDDWFKARSGCATASAFIDIVAVGKRNGEPLKARTDYLWKVATERLYGTPVESASARSLDWGIELEPYAKAAYEEETGYVIIESDFVPHPTIAHCGGSPDGLVSTDGGIEVKCPKDRRIHMQTWQNGMPVDHMPQVQGNMWVTGRKWWDFISFDPRAPAEFRLYVQRIERDDKYIATLEGLVVSFLAEVEKLIGTFYVRCENKGAALQATH
jgi:hypothetical protein